jgi:hypothetical protein
MNRIVKVTTIRRKIHMFFLPQRDLSLSLPFLQLSFGISKIILLVPRPAAHRVRVPYKCYIKQESYVNMSNEPCIGGHSGVISLPGFGGPVHSLSVQAWLRLADLAWNTLQNWNPLGCVLFQQSFDWAQHISED